MQRALICLFLSLTLGVASVALAVARTDGGLSRQITICTGQGAAVISLDASGNPIRALHHCPECLISVTFALPPVAVRILPSPAQSVMHPPARAATAPDPDHVDPRAQGPPVSV